MALALNGNRGGGGAAAPLAAIVWDTATTQTLPLFIAWDAPEPLTSQGSGFTRSADMKSFEVDTDGIYVISVEVNLDASTPANLGSMILLQATTSTLWNGQATMFAIPPVASPAPYNGTLTLSATSNEFIPAGGAIKGLVSALGAPGAVSLIYAGISITRHA